MTYPIQSGPSFRAAQTGEICQTLFFAEQLRSIQTSYSLLFNSSIITQWGKPSNLWTPCVYSLRPRVLSWICIRWIQFATHRNNFTSHPKLARSTAMQNFAPTPSYFISGEHFLETFTLLSETTRTTNTLKPLAMIRTFSYDKQWQKVPVRILRLTIVTDNIIGTF